MDIFGYFRQLCAIPHCSKDASQMLTYLETKARAFGYGVSVDAAGNLLCTHPDAVLTLQSHYDMVCIGRAPEIELVEHQGTLRAKGSTLGADNGMGMAIMLKLMEEGRAVDCLFTADEEVGLLGARALDVPIKTAYLLNLDSEQYGEITIGCAGGVDLDVTVPLCTEEGEKYLYDITVEGYAGGHSGVDIDKNIPNAIKELACILYDMNASLVSIEGGERRNAIAKSASAQAAFDHLVEDRRFRYVKQAPCRYVKTDVVRMLHGFAHGVRAYDRTLGIVDTSINLAEVSMQGETLNIRLSARAMRETALERIESETRAYFEAFGASVKSLGYYAPWEPRENSFVSALKQVYETQIPDVCVGAIHAGLECGIIGQKFPDLQMASIGPTIRYPHSTREEVELDTVSKVFAVVERLLETV